MVPSNDPLYEIHVRQARQNGVKPLPYKAFSARLRSRPEQEVASLLAPKRGTFVHKASSREPKFSLGNVYVTPNAISEVPRDEIIQGVKRHEHGDWGELTSSDIAQNERALKFGGRLCSRYLSSGGHPFYVITEADRSVTTVLLPEDY